MLAASRILRCICWLGFFLVVEAGFGAGLSDFFSNREVITGESLLITGSNVGATIEPREPLHADKPGGHSVWISWIPPTNGLATLSTEGSTFDTLLAVYRMEPGEDPPLERLEEIDSNDDSGTNTFTVLRLGVDAGMRYEIAIDGFAGAAGTIQLSLDVFGLGTPLPRVVRKPGDRSVRVGDTLILTVDIQPTESQELRWFFNKTELDEETSPTLLLPNFQGTNAGQYRLRLSVEDAELFSAPVEIQINSEGFFDTLARNKPEDAIISGLGSGSGQGGRVEGGFQTASVGDLTRGYNGTQIFNTLYASRDPLEPQHCGVPGGASYWFSYVPPQDGEATFDTEGSDFDTLLAAYTFVPPLAGYESLIPIDCDNNSGSNGLTSRIQFNATGGRTYFIVVDGVSGARGIAHLNYQLESGNPPPLMPFITGQPRSQIVAPSNTVVLQVVAGGAVPLGYLWRRNGQPLTNQTRATLTLANVQTEHQGAYSVCVSNSTGLVISADAQIGVQTQPLIRLQKAPSAAVIGFPALQGYQYHVQSTDALGTSNWNLLAHALTDGAGMVWMTNQVSAVPARFFRLETP